MRRTARRCRRRRGERQRDFVARWARAIPRCDRLGRCALPAYDSPLMRFSGRTSRSRGAIRPSFASNFLTLQSEGAGKAGCALHPRSRVQMCNKKRTRAYRFSGGIRLSLRNGLRLIRALPGDPDLLVTVAGAIASADLTPTLRLSGPHDFAVRFRRPRQERHPRPPHPRPALVTLRNAPLGGTGWRCI